MESCGGLAIRLPHVAGEAATAGRLAAHRTGRLPIRRSMSSPTNVSHFWVHWWQVQTASYARQLIALLCIATVLAVALTPGADGLASVILAPFWLFVEILVVLSIQRTSEDRDPYPFRYISAVPSRAPPIQ